MRHSIRLRLIFLFAVPMAIGNAMAQSQAGAKPELVLAYWSSKDCQWCTYWESSWSGMQDGLKNSEEFKKLNYRVIKNTRLSEPYTLEDFPPDVCWIKDRIDRGEEKVGMRPAWSLYANGVRVGKFYGTKDWESKTLPEIKRLVAKYSGDGEPGSTAERDTGR